MSKGAWNPKANGINGDFQVLIHIWNDQWPFSESYNGLCSTEYVIYVVVNF